MILLKILLLFLFCDNFTQLKAQLNKCVTPEGNEGSCMNIWQCTSQIKYIFSDAQNSLQTYNILKSVCDYTNSTIKICCALSSNTKSNSILQENKNAENLKKNTTCNDNNNEKYTEEPVARIIKLNNLELNKIENKTEPPIMNYQYDEIQGKIIPISEEIHEISTTEIITNKNAELKPPNINCKTNLTEINNKENLINDKNTFANENIFKPVVQTLVDSMKKIENNIHDPIGFAKRNTSVDSVNYGNKINNNTFIIINMKDKSSIFNNINNLTVSNNQQDKNTVNSSTNEISMDLFKKILCVIFGKTYNSAAFSQDNSDKSLEFNQNLLDVSIETKDPKDVSIELASETSISLENTNSLEYSISEKQTENTDFPDTHINYVTENSILETLLENMNSSENKSVPFEIENTSENGFSTSEESEEIFNYIALPNPPFCGINKKHSSKEYSWQVLLKEENKKSTKDFCKGTLITRQHIVTTAYCVTNREIESVLIRLEKMSAYITLRIEDIKVHEEFESGRIQNDIALIKLFKPIALEEISPICLIVDSNLTKNLTGVVAYSTGYLKYYHISSKKSVKLISKYECINELDDLEDILDIDDNVLCSKSKATTGTVCLGNEGSPLVIKGKFDGYLINYQIGIVSEVNNCDANNHLGIFVRINAYLNWLLKNM